MDGVIPEVPLPLSQEARRVKVKVFWKVEQCWEIAATSLHDHVFLILVNVTSERTIALVATVSGGGSGCPRQRWKGGEGCIVLGGMLMGAVELRSALLGKRCLILEEIYYRAGETHQGAITVVSLQVGRLGETFQFPKTDSDSSMRFLRVPGDGAV